MLDHWTRSVSETRATQLRKRRQEDGLRCREGWLPLKISIAQAVQENKLNDMEPWAQHRGH